MHVPEKPPVSNDRYPESYAAAGIILDDVINGLADHLRIEAEIGSAGRRHKLHIAAMISRDVDAIAHNRCIDRAYDVITDPRVTPDEQIKYVTNLAVATAVQGKITPRLFPELRRRTIKQTERSIGEFSTRYVQDMVSIFSETPSQEAIT